MGRYVYAWNVIFVYGIVDSGWDWYKRGATSDLFGKVFRKGL